MRRPSRHILVIAVIIAGLGLAAQARNSYPPPPNTTRLDPKEAIGLRKLWVRALKGHQQVSYREGAILVVVSPHYNGAVLFEYDVDGHDHYYMEWQPSGRVLAYSNRSGCEVWTSSVVERKQLATWLRQLARERADQMSAATCYIPTPQVDKTTGRMTYPSMRPSPDTTNHPGLNRTPGATPTWVDPSASPSPTPSGKKRF